MKITLNKLFLIILFILNVSCQSGSNITDTSPPSNSECTSDVCISIQNVNLSSNILEVWMLNNIPVAGFQFDISGVTIISA